MRIAENVEKALVSVYTVTIHAVNIACYRRQRHYSYAIIIEILITFRNAEYNL